MKAFLVLLSLLFINNDLASKPISSYLSSRINADDDEGQKFCFDDTYGSTGLKLRITLFDNRSAKLEWLRDGEVVRRGNASWRESAPMGDNSIVTLNLSTGASLKFTAVLSLMKRKTTLVDSRDNIYVECY